MTRTREVTWHPTRWSEEQFALRSPDGRHIYMQTRVWNREQPILRWALLHPMPSGVVVSRCVEIAEQSGYGGVDIRYLFTLATSNQENLADDVPLTHLSNTYLMAGADPATPLLAGWKLRGGSSALRAAVAVRVRTVASLGLHAVTADPTGRGVFAPSAMATNLRIEGVQPLDFLRGRTADSAQEEAPRVLVTGSRNWTDREAVETSLRQVWQALGNHPGAILIEGECPYGGADEIARDTWQALGLPVEPHPALRSDSGYLLGAQRNAQMVARRPHVCVAYPLPDSKGTRNCMRLAAEAGVPILIVEPSAVGG